MKVNVSDIINMIKTGKQRIPAQRTAEQKAEQDASVIRAPPGAETANSVWKPSNGLQSSDHLAQCPAADVALCWCRRRGIGG